MLSSPTRPSVWTRSADGLRSRGPCSVAATRRSEKIIFTWAPRCTGEGTEKGCWLMASKGDGLGWCCLSSMALPVRDRSTWYLRIPAYIRASSGFILISQEPRDSVSTRKRMQIDHIGRYAGNIQIINFLSSKDDSVRIQM
jgi:hypothetical protein